MIPNKPHFFQPLLPGFELQFSIPVAFYEKYFNRGKQGSDQFVVLRTRRGKLHAVRVSGREFKDGWKEFVEEHDLHVGDFLVFRLDGEMVFHVMVFDPTVCERQYHVSSSAPPKQNQAPPAPAAAGNVFVNAEADEIRAPAVEEQTKGGDFHLDEGIGDEARIGAEEVGSGFPNKPFFEFTVGTDSTLKHRVYMPAKFARVNGLAGKCCQTIVMDAKGRPWPARLVSYPTSSSAVQMGLSWAEFQKNNGVEMGDRVRVELVQGRLKPVFRMSGCGMRRMEKEPVREEAATPAVVVSRDSLNVEVVQDGLKRAFKERELDPNPKKDTIEIEEVKQEPVREEAVAAAAESSKDRNSYTVNLTKGSSKELDPTPKKNTKGIEWEIKQELVHEESATAAAATVPSNVENSCFTVNLTGGYLRGGFLNLPKDFAIKNGLHGIARSVILVNHVGTPFLVELKTTQAGRPYIGAGWGEVVETNHFKMGDELRFQLVESGANPVMNFKVVAKAKVEAL